MSSDPRGDYAYEHSFGGMSRQAYEDDPKRLAFTTARYKHTAKILEGYGSVLEVGCADGYWSRIVAQHVRRLTAIDSDQRSIEEARRRQHSRWPVEFVCYDIQEYVHCVDDFDAVYALDVLEHIHPDEEFLRVMVAIAPVAVIGIPSIESQVYASEPSRLGHVNCYSGPGLRTRLLEFWPHVFMFSMNDEALGTGFLPMAQYLLALCVR